MTTVYLALGSNVGDSREYLTKAIALLKPLLTDLRQASIYRSKAVGYTDQPDFLNTALSGHTGLTPQELLKKLKLIEQEVGRTASFRWGPRQIDIDIILYGDKVLRTEDLTLPHPSFRERDFVLKPLCDLDPSLTDPISGQTVKQLLDELKPGNASLIQRVD